MSSDSDTEDYSSDWTEESSCGFGSPPCRPVPQPVRRLVDIEEPSQAPKYNFTVLYNERVPTGARVEIAPEQNRRPFKPNAPRPPGERVQDDTMWGGPFGTHDRTEMFGIDQSKHNDLYTGLDKFSAHPYPFASEDGFNTKDQWLGGIGPLPSFGSHVKQGMGDVSQQIMERYNGARGFRQPKREVEKSHPRNRQLPVSTPNFADWQDRYADALKDKKPFELPFQQGRDTGDRTMPFGGDPLHPELRVLPTDHLKHTQSLPTRIHNIPTQAQANPNGHWMQGTQPWPEMREPMFDYSDTFRTPAPGPSDAYQPPLLQAPIRVPVTNRADTEFEWRGPIGNSSASARALDQNFTHAPPRVAPEENPWPGVPGDPGCGAPGHVATGITARMTQREGNEWYNQPGPASGPGQTPMQYTDQTRPTIRQTTEESVVLPRIVRSDNGVGPMTYNPARPTGKQTTEEGIVPPVLQAGSGQTPMQYTDQTRPTTKQTLESAVVMGPMQNTGPSAPTEHYSDQFRPTLREGVESLVVQPPQQLPQGGAVTMPYLDVARSTQREDTEQLTQVGRISGAASGKGAVRHYDDEFRDTRREFTAENPQLGPALNSSAAAGGYTSTGIQVPQTERNRGMEDTYSFGPVSAETKSPMDRSYITNITFDDRKEVGLYNRIPARDRFTDVPRNLYGNYNLPPDDQLDFTRTGNPDYSQENQRRLIPSSHYSPNKDLLQVNECRFIEPYQIQQLATNPYSTDVRVIAGQSNY